MPSREWKFRIQDIIESIEKIEQYLNGISLEMFKRNHMIVDAVVRNLEIIGEASNHIPEKIRSKYPTIPWHQMKGIRNILIHEYFGVDTETVWHSAKKHLPPLKNQLKEIIRTTDG